MFRVDFRHRSDISIDRDKLIAEVQYKVKELPINPDLMLCLQIPRETSVQFDAEIINELDKMGWESRQIISTEDSRSFIFVSKTKRFVFS